MLEIFRILSKFSLNKYLNEVDITLIIDLMLINFNLLN